MRVPVRLAGFCLAAGAACVAGMQAQSSINALTDGFRTPPASAQPLTWWHWTNRMVGDRRAAPEQRGFAPGSLPSAMGQFGGPQEPLTSGLLGPVRLVKEVTSAEPASR